MQLLSKEEFEHFHLALETHNSICFFVICQYLHASLLVFVKTHRKCPGDDDDNDDDDDDDDTSSYPDDDDDDDDDHGVYPDGDRVYLETPTTATGLFHH